MGQLCFSRRSVSAVAVLASFGCCGLVCAQPYGQRLGPSIVRWYPSKEAAEAGIPSHALETQPKSPPEAVPDFPIRPEYGAAEGRATARIHIEPGTSLYGVGREHGAFLRNGQTFDNLPVDTPWVLAVRADGTAFGAFVDTTYAAGVNLADDIVFASDDPKLAVVAIKGDSPQEVVKALTGLTGRMEMPPLWAFGYQQFSAFTADQLRLAADWLRTSAVPSGSLWLMVDPDGWPVTYREEIVPDIKSLCSDMRAKGFRIIGGIGKAIPDTVESPLLAQAMNGNHFLRNQDGEVAQDEMGDTRFHLVDYSRKATREWWSDLVKKFLEPGVSGITSARWTTGSLPVTVQVQADPELGGPDSALRYQTVLDAQFARATRDGFGGEASNRRPFVMVDARAIGAQRYTGALIDWPEKDPNWPQIFTAAALNTALSGQPLVSTLIKPPFQGEGSDTNVLWIGTAATFPIVAGSFFLPQDFSQFPEPAESVIREAMERRAKLTPYLYTLCFRSFMDLDPIMCPLFFDDPKDAALRNNQAGFLIGHDLLVVPRPSPGVQAPIPLKGKWRRLDFGDNGDQFLPDLYLRPGAILPLGPVMDFPGQKAIDPITIIANPDDQGNAYGTLYEDAGDGYEFYKNQARRIGYKITREDGAYMVRLANLDFGLPLPERKLEIRILTDGPELHGQGSERGTVKIDSAPTAPSSPEKPR